MDIDGHDSQPVQCSTLPIHLDAPCQQWLHTSIFYTHLAQQWLLLDHFLLHMKMPPGIKLSEISTS